MRFRRKRPDFFNTAELAPHILAPAARHSILLGAIGREIGLNDLDAIYSSDPLHVGHEKMGRNLERILHRLQNPQEAEHGA